MEITLKSKYSIGDSALLGDGLRHTVATVEYCKVARNFIYGFEEFTRKFHEGSDL